MGVSSLLPQCGSRRKNLSGLVTRAFPHQAFLLAPLTIPNFNILTYKDNIQLLRRLSQLYTRHPAGAVTC